MTLRRRGGIASLQSARHRQPLRCPAREKLALRPRRHPNCPVASPIIYLNSELWAWAMCLTCVQLFCTIGFLMRFQYNCLMWVLRLRRIHSPFVTCQMSKSGSLRKKPHSSSPEHTRLHRIYNLILTTSTSTSFSSQAMTSTIGTSAATASRKRMSERTIIGNDDIERKTSTCLKTLHREARKHGDKPWMYQKTTIILAHR